TQAQAPALTEVRACGGTRPPAGARRAAPRHSGAASLQSSLCITETHTRQESALDFLARLLNPIIAGTFSCRSVCCMATREMPAMSEVTRILSAIEQGNPNASEQLLPLVYDELRKLAAQRLGQEKPGQTLQATALVHEAYLRLVGGVQPHGWNGRGHFF